MSLLLSHARVVDVRQGKVLTDHSVLIEGARIAAVAPSAEIAPLQGTTVIDVAGRTMLPGFIDCHAHLAAVEYDLEKRLTTPASLTALKTAANLRTTLEAGVTTVREAGGVDAGLRTAVETGLIPGPRLQLSLMMIAQTGGIWDLHLGSGASVSMKGIVGETVRYSGGVEALRQLSRELLAAGADLLNIYTTSSIHKHPRSLPSAAFTPAEIEAVVYEAHNAGKRVMAHVDGGPGVAAAIRAGADSVDHPYYLSDDDIELLLKHDTALVPTLACNYGILRSAERDPHAGIHETALETARHIVTIHEEGFRRALAAGVRIAMGSDSYGAFQAENLLELELMVRCGMSPLQAIQTGTLESAGLMGLDDRLGTLEIGKLADLLVVDGDPLQDVTILQRRENLSLIVKNGEIIRSRLPADPQ